jgi:hypothetical protein
MFVLFVSSTWFYVCEVGEGNNLVVVVVVVVVVVPAVGVGTRRRM